LHGRLLFLVRFQNIDVAVQCVHSNDGATATKTASLAQNPYEYILYEVFAFGPLPRHLKTKLIHRLVVTLEECCEARCVAIGDALN
jgi:hypothetical protein